MSHDIVYMLDGGDLGDLGERERVGGKAGRKGSRRRAEKEQAGEETEGGPRGSTERVKEEQGNREGKQGKSTGGATHEVVVANQLCLITIMTSKPPASSLRKLAEFENLQKIPI
jgi:hypothetical protein